MTVLKVVALIFGLFSMPVFAQNETTAPAETTTTANAAASGQSKFTCTMNGKTRTVEVVYENPNTKIPCKVDYTKDDDGAAATPTALWTASNLEGYCEEKAATFTEKLKSSGWNCL